MNTFIIICFLYIKLSTTYMMSATIKACDIITKFNYSRAKFFNNDFNSTLP